MLPTSRFLARLLDWLIILLMLLFSSTTIGLLLFWAGSMEQPASSEPQVDWLHVLFLAVVRAWGVTPLIASCLALKSRKAAGWVWFLGAVPVWTATALVLNAGGGWTREFWVMIVVAAILLAISGYWLSDQRKPAHRLPDETSSAPQNHQMRWRQTRFGRRTGAQDSAGASATKRGTHHWSIEDAIQLF